MTMGEPPCEVANPGVNVRTNNIYSKFTTSYEFNLTVNQSKEQLETVSKKLDSIKLEILRLRASLLPEEELTAEEKKELRIAMKEFEEGKAAPFSKLKKKR